MEYLTALWPREVLMCMQTIRARVDVSHTYMVTSNKDVLWQSLCPCVLLPMAVKGCPQPTKDAPSILL